MTLGRLARTLTTRAFFGRLCWIDGRPLLQHLEPYRLQLFEHFFDTRDEAGRLRYNLGLFGRAKKNWKTADLVLACFYALLLGGTSNEVYIVANDEDQAGDDLALAKKLIKANTLLGDWLTVKKNVIERKDGDGFIEILPAQDAIGSHGKTYRLLAVDEVHGYRTWNLLEALAPDPSRADAQQWITSYASVFHRPGVPLFDLCRMGRDGSDARMLFSWYAADYCTDPAFASRSPEERANPSMASWNNPSYLALQQRRLPAHKYRRLHLNLPGLPEGSAFQPEPVMDAIARGITARRPDPAVSYAAFVDMSGGSSDDAVLGIAHRSLAGHLVLDRLLNQGPPPPFDPRAAIDRFVSVLREFGCTRVTGDRYAGETFARDFQRAGIGFDPCPQTKSQLYEALEPVLNAHQAVLLDVPLLEQQLLGLHWRGGRIDHLAGEHDDWANAAAGAVLAVGLARERTAEEEQCVLALYRSGRRATGAEEPDDAEGLLPAEDEVVGFNERLRF